MASGYKFPILNSDGSTSTTVVDFEDMFVRKEQFLESGLYSWGQNGAGQLGQSLIIITNRSSPVQVGTLTNWKLIINGGYHTNAIKADGTLWTWGYNIRGNLGLGDANSRSSPVQVGSLTNWKSTSAGEYHNLAITASGNLWAWGGGLFNYGVLGTGDTVHRSSPVQVGSLTDWKLTSCGQYHSAAIKTNGTLWAWGRNSNGQLGQGDLVHRSSPVQVGSLTDWKQVACGTNFVAALKTNGTLWSWGQNAEGQLGLLDVTHRSSPVQVGSLTDWKYVASSVRSLSNVAALKTNGTLWVWGHNDKGQLGQGDLVHRSSPVQVGSLTDWKQVACGANFVAALKTNGTLWAWGQNGSGQLGLNDIVNRSSPVQVGSLTSWKTLTNGSGHVVAILSPDLP